MAEISMTCLRCAARHDVAWIVEYASRCSALGREPADRILCASCLWGALKKMAKETEAEG